jgi:hypothetical protein
MISEEEPVIDEDIQEEEVEELSIEADSPSPLSFEAIIGREVEDAPGVFESTPDLPDLNTDRQIVAEEEPGLDDAAEAPVEIEPVINEEPFIADIPHIIKTSEPIQTPPERFTRGTEEGPSITDTHITIPAPPPPNRVPPVPPASRMLREEATPQTQSFVAEPQEVPPPKKELSNTIVIAGCKIDIELPPHIVDQNRSSGMDQKRKIAGVLAAQTLEKNPQLTASPTVDPVSVWSDILNAIVERLN